MSGATCALFVSGICDYMIYANVSQLFFACSESETEVTKPEVVEKVDKKKTKPEPV